jgi:hypothetical protein
MIRIRSELKLYLISFITKFYQVTWKHEISYLTKALESKHMVVEDTLKYSSLSTTVII